MSGGLSLDFQKDPLVKLSKLALMLTFEFDGKLPIFATCGDLQPNPSMHVENDPCSENLRPTSPP